MTGAALFLSGCTTTKTAVVPPTPARSYKLTVVESPLNRTLSPQEAEQLQTYVLQYLLTQGPVRNDTYTVRIDFPPEAPGAVSEYMIVQLTAEAQPSYTVLTDYPEPWYYNPYYVGYSYFGLMGYSYYDQLNYDHSHYYRPIPPPAHYARPHPPANGHYNTGQPTHAGPGTPGVAHQRPKDGSRNPEDRGSPAPANPGLAHNQPGADGYHRTPPTGVTQRNDPGNRSGGHPQSGTSAPVARTENSRGGGGRSTPPPSYSPPPARESAPVRETAQTSSPSRGKGDTSAQEQER